MNSNLPHTQATLPPLTFINLLTETWNSPWLTHQPVMNCLSRDHRVLYVLKEPALDRMLEQRQFPKARIERISDAVYEYHPGGWQPKIYFSRALDNLSRRRRFSHIHTMMDELGWNNPILYAWHPDFHGSAGYADEMLSVFHIHDHYPSFDKAGTAEREQSERDYAALIKEVDQVFACSAPLVKTVEEHRQDHVHLIENGVDYARFTAAREDTRPLPPELIGLQRPIVGHIGRIDSRVDIGLMAGIARRRPDWTVLLLGPLVGTVSKIQAELDEFKQLPNTIYVEGKSVPELPFYIKALDVGLLCYKTEGTWMPFGSPLKMFEYFAMGKPAVCSYISSLKKYEPILRLAERTEDWVPLIQSALDESSPAAVEARLDIGEQNSWQRRADNVLELMSAHPRFSQQVGALRR